MKTAPPAMASSRRSFGEVLSTNTDITDSTSSTAVINDGMAFSSSIRVASTCSSVDSTETSETTTVSQLRSRLNEWGQKNQQQALKGGNSNPCTTTTTAAAISSSHDGTDGPPRRPIVRPSNNHEVTPTPLPPAAALALAKRMTHQTTPSVLNMTSSHGSVRFDASIGNTSTMASSATSTGYKTSNVASFRARSTPIRFRVPTLSVAEASNVQATNEGYASVAELSRWLADDPTSTKKTLRHLRRGANIIAKSRKFDKVLANIVIVEETIPRDCVSKQKEKLLKWSGHSGTTIKDTINEHRQAISNMVHENDDDDMSVQSMSEVPATKKDWMMLGTMSSASVADKKKWLNSAFPTSASKSTCPVIMTDSHQPQQFQLISSTQSDIGLTVKSDWGNRAKDQWRRNRSHIKPASVYPSRSSLSLYQTIRTQDSSDAARTKVDDEKVPTIGCVDKTDKHGEDIPASFSTAKPETTKSADEVPLDFRLARDLLVQRSKANGNAVEVVSASTLRGAMVEMLEKDAQPKTSSHSLLKPSWEGSKEGYVKKYR